MPKLKPEDISMVGLNLFTQLCGLAQLADPAGHGKPMDEQVSRAGRAVHIATHIYVYIYSTVV